MISILKCNSNVSRKLCCTPKSSVVTFLRVQSHEDFSRQFSTSKTVSNSQLAKVYFTRRASLQPTLPSFNLQNQRSCYTNTDASVGTFANFQHHEDFSKMLIYLDKDLTHEISELVAEWLNRFDSLGPIEVFCISAALNTLSKLDIFDKMWKREEQENFKKLIIKLAVRGDKLLDPEGEPGVKFSSWQIANCLNALSKWNVLKSKIWEGTVNVDDKVVTKYHVFESFITRLIYQGNWLLDTKSKMATEFNSQSVANCLNALSKWNINELKGAKEFIVQLMKQSNIGSSKPVLNLAVRTDRVTSLSIVKSLNALSKWDSDELQGSREFINQLMKQGVQMVNLFIPQEVANSLNALSKWNIDNLYDSKDFIVRLVKRGTIIVDKFNCQDIANCLNALCKWNIHEIQGAREFIIRLMKRGSSTAGGFKPQEIGNCLNAVSKWNIEELPGAKNFIDQLVRCGNLTHNKFNPQGVSNSLNALAKWNVNEMSGATEFIVYMVKRGCSTSDGFNAQEIANSLNALSKWNIDELQGAGEFISRLTRRGCSTVIGFNSQGVANSLNALCKWNVNELQGGRDFIVQLIKRGSSIPHGFDFKNIANSLNALSKWDIEELPGAREFIVLLIEQGTSTIDQFDSHSIANCLNALSKWNIEEFKGSKEFIVRLIQQGSMAVDKFSPQAISNSLNALSKWNIDELPQANEFIVRMIERGTLTSGEFDSQEIANSLNALSKWDIDYLPGAREFINRLIKQGSLPFIRFTPQGVANSLNSFFKWIILSKFDISSSSKENDAEMQNIKDFIIKLSANGEELFEEFDSQNVSNTFNSFSEFDILNDENWTKNQRNQLESFVLKLCCVDEAYKNYTLEGISRTYGTLIDWDVLNNDKFDSGAINNFKNLVGNLENRILTIAMEQDLLKPDIDVRFAAQIIKDLSTLRAKSLVGSGNKLLISLVKILRVGVERCDTSVLNTGRMQKYVLSGLQSLHDIVIESKDRSNLNGVFDQHLSMMINTLAALNVSYADDVLEKVIELDELGIIKDRQLLSKLRKFTRY